MPLFHLDWCRDAVGYELTDQQPEGVYRFPPTDEAPWEIPDGLEEFFAPESRSWVTRKSDRDLQTRPLEIPGLYRRLAEYDVTESDALRLVEDFGFLSRSDARYESVHDIWGGILRLREIIKLADRRDFKFCPRPEVHVELIAPLNVERPSLRLQPTNLLEGAIVQLLEDISSARQLRRCIRPGCREWFAFGPGTGRRKTALYCSPRCQKAHDYMKRKEATP